MHERLRNRHNRDIQQADVRHQPLVKFTIHQSIAATVLRVVPHSKFTPSTDDDQQEVFKTLRSIPNWLF